MYLRGKYRLIFIFVLMSAALKSEAQDTLNSVVVEQKSYQLYLDKKWNELENYGNKAIRNGFDYYYLRMRIGIAYYESENYFLAELHFRKALKFNSGDITANEYLYYCYIYLGRFEEARRLSRSFTKSLAEKTGTDSLGSLAFFLAEGGEKASDSSLLFNNAFYLHAGLEHFIANRFSVYHAVTYFNQDQFIGKTLQFQYYLRGIIPLGKGWRFSPAIHLIWRQFTPPPIMVSYSGGGPKFPVPQAPIGSNYFIGSFVVSKMIPHFALSLGSTYSSGPVKQTEHFAGISFYPLGNARLILGGNGFLHTEDNYATNLTAFTPFIIFSPVKNITLSAKYLYNIGSNIVEENGYIVNNSSDLTTERWSYMASFSLSKTFDLYGIYQLENKTESVQQFKYHYRFFIAGCIIKFL